MSKKRTCKVSGCLSKKKYILFFVLFCFIFLAHPVFAKTLVLDGSLESKINTTQSISFSVNQKLASMTFKFALPTSFSNKVISQNISSLNVKITPEPSSVSDDVDKFGNKFKKLKWENTNADINVLITFNASIKSELHSMESLAQFPLNNMSQQERMFLSPTSLVQSDNQEMISIAKQLTANSKTENEAVSAILNWVSDNVKYIYNPPQYDAIHTLKTGTGNCQNFAHLSMALLRAAGIPARIVGGISLKRQWKVPIENGYLVQDQGQGGHAWMEIYFSDLGWLSYDPQQSKQFTSTRHIKQTHGLDSKDINDTWSAAPYLPKYSENIEAVFNSDAVDVKLQASKEAPKSYLMSNNLTAKVSVEKPPVTPFPPVEKPPVTPPPVIKRPEPPQKKKGDIEFGNINFPELVNAYQVTGNEGSRIFDKETAEYVTSRYVYAQSFTIDETMSLRGIALAMRKFGGDGTLYVDVVKDDNGKPGFSGERSLPISLSSIKFRPGYYWVDFAFTRRAEPLPVLQPGKYWIIMRHSGEAIVNWFFIPGNPYGDGDDTRSTVKGYKWEDLLNYDFVFKVKARI